MKLKPCQCQSNTLTIDERDTFSVHCLDCGAYGPVKATEEEAVAAWNSRPTEDALRTENETLRYILNNDCGDMNFAKAITQWSGDAENKALRKRVDELEQQLSETEGYPGIAADMLRLREDVTELEVLLQRTEYNFAKSDDEVEQVLGQALKFPWYKDDQKNFPGATEENGVCVGDHIPQSIAAVAAKRIQALEELLNKILSSGYWYECALEIDQYSKTGFNNGKDMQKEILKTLGLEGMVDAVLEEVAKACRIPVEVIDGSLERKNTPYLTKAEILHVRKYCECGSFKEAKEEPSLLGLVGEAFSKENLIKDLVCKARVCPEDEVDGCPRTRGVVKNCYECWNIQSEDTVRAAWKKHKATMYPPEKERRK